MIECKFFMTWCVHAEDALSVERKHQSGKDWIFKIFRSKGGISNANEVDPTKGENHKYCSMYSRA